MISRDEQIYREAEALWRQVFDAPPPAQADGRTLLDMIARESPIAGYEQLRSPFLRPSTITGPKTAASPPQA
jgi:hypothetical protein